MYLQLHLLAAVRLAFAFAQAPAPAADALPSTAPLAPSAPAATVFAFNPVVSLIQSALKDPTVNDPTPVTPLLSLVHSGIKTPTTPPVANPVVSLIQSGMRDPAMTPNPIVSLIRSTLRPTTTYTQEPSFALSDIEFGSTLVPAPKPTINPVDPESTPGEVRFCTSAAYTSWNGDAADAICDAIQTELGSCRNLSAALRGKVRYAPRHDCVCSTYPRAISVAITPRSKLTSTNAPRSKAYAPTKGSCASCSTTRTAAARRRA